MAFTDNLAYALFSLSFAGFLILYLVVSEYITYVKKNKNYADYTARLEAAKAPLLLVGAYMVIMGLWGQMTWPLPGSYNILFYDPLLSFGMIVLALGLSIHFRVRFEYVGFFGLLIGIMTIIYGVQGYSIGLTEEPLALLALYGFFGVSGIFSYPVALLMQKLPGLQRNPWVGWTLCLVIFVVAMLGASLLAAYVAVSAIPSHLISAP
jgi:putative membrane protein